MADQTTADKATYAEWPATGWQAGQVSALAHPIAAETPVAFTYQGDAFAVMMASPADLHDLALGFSLSEGIIDHPSELLACEIKQTDKGLIAALRIPDEAHLRLIDRRRALPGRSGCGVCGMESLDGLLPDLPPITSDLTIGVDALYSAYEALHLSQPLKQMTGAVHGAAWCNASGQILLLREDVGRHNALDKLIGAMLRAGHDPASGFALITSRCSYEMVQKSVRLGIPILAAISAPTTLAVDLAAQSGLTLAALTRHCKTMLFSHPGRVTQGETRLAE